MLCSILGKLLSLQFHQKKIISILKQHRDNWQSVWARAGKETDGFEYPAEILQQTGNKKENIISLVM